MPVRVPFSGSSAKPGNASSATRWLAPSLLSQAPVASWKTTSAPTTAPYQSIISCRRVVFRLKWWNFGWGTPVSDIVGSLSSGGGREGELVAQVVDERGQIGGVGRAAEDVEIRAHEHRVRPVPAPPPAEVPAR